MLTKLAHKTSIMDYCQLTEHYLGKRWLFITLYINLISNLGSIIVYLQISTSLKLNLVSNFMMSSLIYFEFDQYGLSLNMMQLIQMILFLIIFVIPLTIFDITNYLFISSFLGTLMFLCLCLVLLLLI